MAAPPPIVPVTHPGRVLQNISNPMQFFVFHFRGRDGTIQMQIQFAILKCWEKWWCKVQTICSHWVSSVGVTIPNTELVYQTDITQTMPKNLVWMSLSQSVDPRKLLRDVFVESSSEGGREQAVKAMRLKSQNSGVRQQIIFLEWCWREKKIVQVVMRALM